MDINELLARLDADGDELSADAALAIRVLVDVIDDINKDSVPARALLRAHNRLTVKGEKDAADAAYKALTHISERTRLARKKLGHDDT